MNAASGPEGTSIAHLSRRLLNNYFAQLLNQGVRVAEQLLLLPLFLLNWGTEIYKDWLVLYAAATLLLACNFGTENYFGNLFFRKVTAGDRQGLRHAIKIGLFSTLVVSAFLCAASAILLTTVDIRSALKLSAMSECDIIFCLTALLIPLLVVPSSGILHSVYRAYGDFSRGEYVYGCYAVTQLGSVAASLALGQPPRVVALCYLVVPLLLTISLIVDLRLRYRDFHLAVAIPTRAEMRVTVQQCALYFTYPLSLMLIQNVPVMVFSVFGTSATAIVTYTVIRTFTGLARQAANQFAIGSGIEMAREYAQNGHDTCRRLYRDTGKYVACLVGLFAGLGIPASEPLIEIWTRGAVPVDYALMCCFFAGAFLCAPAQAALTLLTYSSNPRPLALAWIGQSVGGLLLSVTLVPALSILGAGLGLTVAEFLAIGLYLPFVVRSSFGFAVARHLAESYAVGALIFAISYGVAAFLFSVPAAGIIGIGLKIAGWATIVAPVTLLVILPAARRRSLLGRLRPMALRI